MTIEKNHAQLDVVVFTVKNLNNRPENEYKCSNCNRTNHTTKNCCAHLKFGFCGWKGHTSDYCRKKKATTEVENNATISKGNWATTCLIGKKEMSLPFTNEQCRQILELLKTKCSNANHVTSSSKNDELSGKAFSLNLIKKNNK